MSHYSITKPALDDIDDIWDYIAQHNVTAAERVTGKFYDQFLKIAARPKAFPIHPQIGAPYRFAVVKPSSSISSSSRSTSRYGVFYTEHATCRRRSVKSRQHEWRTMTSRKTSLKQ
jgi:plasmid stabilization system protein ParE